LKVFGAVPAPVETDQIALVGPDIAEDGAAVPLSVTSRLPETEEISILIENNPNLLAVMFSLPEMTDGELVTRVKMAGTSDIYALVKAGGSWYFAKTHVKVTIGGCGD
jgi:sulfur-oxidizing protein SoxY